jgi:hypothetical protein
MARQRSPGSNQILPTQVRAVLAQLSDEEQAVRRVYCLKVE